MVEATRTEPARGDLAEEQTSHLPQKNSKTFFVSDIFNCCWNNTKGQKTLAFQ